MELIDLLNRMKADELMEHAKNAKNILDAELDLTYNTVKRI